MTVQSAVTAHITATNRNQRHNFSPKKLCAIHIVKTLAGDRNSFKCVRSRDSFGNMLSHLLTPGREFALCPRWQL